MYIEKRGSTHVEPRSGGMPIMDNSCRARDLFSLYSSSIFINSSPVMVSFS